MANAKLNLKGLRSLRKTLKNIEDTQLKVGFIDGAVHNSPRNTQGLTVATIATIQEFGLGKGNVERPFFTSTFISNHFYERPLAQQIRMAISKEKGVTKAYSDLGVMIKKDLKDSIRKWSDPPNKPSTSKRKGFNNPLIESRQMLNSVSHKVFKVNQ